MLFSSTRGYPKQKSYKGVYLIKEEQYQVKAPNPFPQDIYQQLINRDQKELFIKGKRILETNKDYINWLGNHPSATDIYAFKFLSYDTLADTGKKYSPLDEGLTDATNISCNFNYIETTINLTKKTFMEAMKKEHYRDHECWINTITDFYGDTLMNNKKRNVLTRDKLLAILNKTEKTVNLGISVKDVTFFQQYRLS